MYPWNTALVTSLYKKGKRSDPNKCRAIAVGSNLGKLFSGILLDRLLQFRNSHWQDTDNQLGFVREAQTSDHIFTLQTCVQKCTRQEGSRLLSCSVAYCKASDTVSREALLFKLGGGVQ
jgi:hypothetical protein